MKTMDFKNSELIALSYDEMLCVNGGNQAAYESGYAAGAYVRNIIEGSLFLKLIFRR